MIEAFWNEFCAAKGVTGPIPAASAFGDSVAMQDDLCALVVAGVKRATATLKLSYEQENEPLPKRGDYWIFTDGSGVPHGVVQTIEIMVTPFCQVDATFAADEGEGDKSLDYWRASHCRFFKDHLAAEGKTFSEDMAVVLERFRLVWLPVS